MDKYSYLASQSQFLDFTLHSFRTNTPLRKIKQSSRLFSLRSNHINFENLTLQENQDAARPSEYRRIKGVLQPFTSYFDKVKGLQLTSLMESLSDLISLNPNYSHEKLIADKLITLLFHQYWSKLLSREEQQYLAESINKYFMQSISMQSFSSN